MTLPVRSAPPDRPDVHAANESLKSLEEALVSYSWAWITQRKTVVVLLYKDGSGLHNGKTKINWKLGEDRVLRLSSQYGHSAVVTFDETFSKFDGVAYAGESVHGERIARVAETVPVTGRPPVPVSVLPPPPAVTAQPVSPVQTPVAPPPARPVASVPVPPVSSAPVKREQAMIEVLSDQAPNVANWITGPLDHAVPEAIWQNMTFLKEALRDEALKNPAASQAAYGLAVRLCYTMVADLETRRQAETLSGGDAVLHQRSNLTEWRRDHLTWPMYFLERDERAERHEKARNAKVFMPEIKVQEWANRGHEMRTVIDAQYSQFREALRQSPAAR